MARVWTLARIVRRIMVLGSHVIFGVYGFWLPNDPRGSWSTFVGSWELARFGRATKTDERRSLAARQHDQEARVATKRALKFPAVQFTGVQARAVGCGFAEFVVKTNLTVWACSVLPEHVHLVLGRDDRTVEQTVNLLKGAATRSLVRAGVHPLAAFPMESGRPPKAWARGQWKVFLSREEDVLRAIRYVEENPLKEGKPRQTWGFVKRYESQ